MTRQRQRSGNESINVQAQNVQLGLSYEDTRQLALDVFEANFAKLAGLAHSVATARAQEIAEEFLGTLQKRAPESINLAAEPGAQRALFQVQESYAASGDAELGNLLVGLLVDRMKEPTRTERQVVLDEALRALPKLSHGHIALLTALFYLTGVTLGEIQDVKSLYETTEKSLAAVMDGPLHATRLSWNHLAYAGCIVAGHVGKFEIGTVFRLAYPGLYTYGFGLNAVPTLLHTKLEGTDILVRSVRNSDLYQLNAINEEALAEFVSNHASVQDFEPTLRSLLHSYHVQDDLISAEIMGTCPSIRRFVEMFENSGFGHAECTSVGVAIAHANLRRILGPGTGIEEWIP